MSTAAIASALVVLPPATPAVLIDVDPSDYKLVALWLDGLSPHTQRAYRADAGQFFAAVHKPLRAVVLDDVQGFASHLKTLPLKPGSRHRKLAAVKSLFAFAYRLGYLPFDVARPLRMPANKDTLSERILDESEVRRLITAAANPRDRLILQLLYVCGLRVSELAGLTWGDAIAHRGAGQLTVFGKGRKTRIVRIDQVELWALLDQLRGESSAASPIFPSANGRHLNASTVLRIVKAAAKRAGIKKAVSPHWLRHCHCSHALDHGAPIHLVQQTVGHSSVATTSRYLHARPNESSSRFLTF